MDRLVNDSEHVYLYNTYIARLTLWPSFIRLEVLGVERLKALGMENYLAAPALDWTPPAVRSGA